MTKLQQNHFLQETVWQKIGNVQAIQEFYLQGLTSDSKQLIRTKLNSIISELEDIARITQNDIDEELGI